MIDFDKLNEQNFLIVAATPACIGALSANIRMVSFEKHNKSIDIYFDIREESAVDREEIDDIADNFAIISEKYAVTAHVEVVGDRILETPCSTRSVIDKQCQ